MSFGVHLHVVLTVRDSKRYASPCNVAIDNTFLEIKSVPSQFGRRRLWHHYPSMIYLLNTYNSGTTHFDSIQGLHWADQKVSHNEVIMTSLQGQ